MLFKKQSIQLQIVAFNSDKQIDGVGTTELVEYPEKRMLCVQFLGGKNFNDWVYLAAEDELYEPIEGEEIKFKGFIDGIIGDVTKRGKRRIWIIDWKTSGPGGWRRDKKQDFLVQAQLASYKIYWSKRENIDPKDIRCAFVLLKREAKPGKSISIVPISVGPKMIEKTNKLVSSMVKGVKRGLSLKNRESCKFCEFKGTEHCT